MNADDLKGSRARQGRPVDPETRQSVVDLHSEGWSRNDIARHLGIAGATVTKIAQEQEPPLVFDRSATALAVAARQLDLAAARQEVSQMLVVAREALESMDSPIEVYSFGGKDNTFASEVLDAPSPADQRNLMTIAAIAVQRHVELVKVDSGRDELQAASVLDGLQAAFAGAAEALRPAAEDTLTEE
jgi:hypothetical protein